MKKNALGRGLDALMPELDIEGGSVVDLNVEEIDINPHQPRRTFKEESLRQLAESIGEMGVLQPILVLRENGRYLIVAGERRFRAARLAGHRTIPAIVRDYTKEEQMEAALVENLQREDLNPMEEAAAVRALMDNCRYTQEKAAQRLGKSRPAIANLLRLLQLPSDIADLIRSGALSEGHGRVLAGIEPLGRKRELAERAAGEGWSVRQLEKAAQEKKKPAAVRERPAPEFREFEQQLHRAFGAKARIKGDLEKGQIILTYRNRTELDAVYEAVERLL